MVASVLLVLAALVAVGVAFGRLSERDLLGRVMALDRTVTGQDLDDNDDLQAGLAMLFALAELAAAVPVLMWVHRVVRNGPALGARETRFSPGWAVGWWFIPFAHLVQPLRALNEAWRGSDPRVGATDPAARARLALTPTLLLWWLAWHGGTWLYSIALGVRSDAIDEAESGVGVGGTLDALDRVRSMDALIAAAMAVHVLAAVLLVVLIRSLTARQEQKARGLLAPPGAWRPM